MATKKVETKSRSANPRATAAGTKAAPKTTKVAAKPEPKSKTVVPKTKAAATPKATTKATTKAATKTAPKVAPKAEPKGKVEANKASTGSSTRATAETKVAPVNVEKKTIKNGTITFEQIAARAYEIWSERGYSHGNDVDDWCRAEAELKK